METKIEIQGLGDIDDLPAEMKLELLRALRSMTSNSKKGSGGAEFFQRMQNSVGKNYEDLYDFIDNSNHNEQVIDRKLYIPRLHSEKGKTFFDVLTALKIYNKRELLDATKFSLRELLGKATADPSTKKTHAAFVMLFGQSSFRQSNDIHGAFRFAPEYRLLVWALDKLKFPKPKNMNEFSELYKVTPHEDWGTECSLTLLNDPKQQFFDNFSTEHIWETFRLFLEHFKGTKLNDLNPEWSNVVKAYLFSIYRLFPFDIIVLSLLKKYTPEFISLCEPYTSNDSMIDFAETLFKEGGELDDMAVAGSTICKSVLDSFTSKMDDVPKLTLEHSLIHYAEYQGLFINLASLLIDSRSHLDEKIYETIFKSVNQFEKITSDLASIEVEANKLGDMSGRFLEFTGSSKQTMSFISEAKNLLTIEQENGAPPPSVDHIKLAEKADVDSEFLQVHIDQVCKNVDSLRIKSMEEIQSGDIDAAQKTLGESRSYPLILEKMIDEFDMTLMECTALVESGVSQIRERQSTDLSNQEAPNSAEVIEGLRSDIAQLTNDNKALRAQLANKSDSTSSTPVEQAHQFSQLTKKALFGRLTCADVFDLMSEQYPYVKFSDNFQKYAKDCKYGSISKLLKQVQLLCDDYYLAIKSGKPDSVAKDILGHAFRANESATVMGNDTLRNYRMFAFNGERRLITKHLTMGSAHDERKTVQVYFEIDGDALLVAYVGSHLPLA